MVSYVTDYALQNGISEIILLILQILLIEVTRYVPKPKYLDDNEVFRKRETIFYERRTSFSYG